MSCDLSAISADVKFGAPSLNASLCEFKLKLPTFSFGFTLPPLPFPPVIPFPKFGFALSCDPSKPISVSAGIKFGGGRLPCFDSGPDDVDLF
jgi:hypothetical protein